MLDATTCRQARLSRDARFDGCFVTAVTSTGIYCRPVCPATPPLERNVRYFDSATAAAHAGFRPCLRCRPDCAPESPAWHGSQTTLRRALRLIDEGALQQGAVTDLCDRLGISPRYLRQLFHQHLGVSPKAYALYRQCLFAKQLLHQSQLPVTQVAFASGFRSLRRFNDAFRAQIGLAPRAVRRKTGDPEAPLTLTLAYRPPYAWQALHDFHARRYIEGLEWLDQDSYGRTLQWGTARGRFTARHRPALHAFEVSLQLDDLSLLAPVVRHIRRMLDLDADTARIEAHLRDVLPGLPLINGLRLPGIWSPFEAGVRAILGQQVSVAAAQRLVTTLVNALGDSEADGLRYFPTPAQMAHSDLAFLGMPDARRQTLRRFAAWHASDDADDDPQTWTALKGIGTWTADYAALRGTSHPDIWLAGDLGIRKALSSLRDVDSNHTDPVHAAPWRSYLTFQLWSQTT